MATVREPNSLPLQPRTPETEDERSQRERMHTVAGHLTSAQRRPRYGQPFFPVTIFGSAMYILATVVALIILSLIHPADSFHVDPHNPAVIPADPINHTKYNPRPEWYFLFLFQLLKYFQGPWEIVGTAVIPGIATVVLLLLPFYDRNWSRRAVRRPIAVGLAGLSVLGIAFLTYTPLAGSVPSSSPDYLSTVAASPKFVNIEAIFAKNCQPCHYQNPASAGLLLDTYANVMKGGQGPKLIPAAGGKPALPAKIVIPGNPTDSYVVQVTKHVQNVGGNMPASGGQISQTDEQNLINWIKNGAKGPTAGS